VGPGLDLLLLSRRMLMLVLVWPNHCMAGRSHSLVLAGWARDVAAAAAVVVVVLVVLGCASLCRGSLACGGGGLPASTGHQFAYVVSETSPLHTERTPHGGGYFSDVSLAHTTARGIEHTTALSYAALCQPFA